MTSNFETFQLLLLFKQLYQKGFYFADLTFSQPDAKQENLSDLLLKSFPERVV